MTVATQLNRLNAGIENKVRTTEFFAAARHLLIGKSHFAALESAREKRATPGVLELLQRAPALPATMSDSTWGGPLSPTPAAAAFLESLRDVTAFDRLLPDMLRVPPRAKVVAVTAGASGLSVGEAMVKPATKLSTTTVSLEMTKSVAFFVVSRELMEMSGAGALAFLRRGLTGAVARVTDDTFISVLTAGISAIPSSGFTALGARADFRALANAVDTGSASSLYFITTSDIAKRLATLGDSSGAQAFPDAAMTGGSVAGVPIVISDSVASGVLLLVDAAQLVASAGDVELSASNEADVQLNDAPDSPPSSSTHLTSMWQNNLSALRATRYLGVARGRDTAVAYVTGFAATGNSPS